MIARLSDLLFKISNDVRGVGKHASMVQTQLEQVAESQRELLDEMNHNIHDFAVRVATGGGKMTQEPLYPEGHPKRIEQDSQINNTSAPSPSKKKKKKENDRTLHTSSEPEIVMTHKYRGSIVVLSISKSVKPNEEQKEMISGFRQGILCKH